MTEKVDGIFNFAKPALLGPIPALDEPKAFMRDGKAQGEPKYSASLSLDPESDDAKGLKALAVQVAKAAFPGRDIGADFRAGKFALPFQNGTKLADDRNAKRGAAGKSADGDWQRGKLVIQARSKFAPRLAVILNGKVTDLDTPLLVQQNLKKFYFGAEVLAQLNLVAYKGVGANPDGVTAYLNILMANGKGTPLSTARSAADVFSGYAGHATDEDPTKGAEDDIPF